MFRKLFTTVQQQIWLGMKVPKALGMALIVVQALLCPGLATTRSSKLSGWIQIREKGDGSMTAAGAQGGIGDGTGPAEEIGAADITDTETNVSIATGATGTDRDLGRGIGIAELDIPDRGQEAGPGEMMGEGIETIVIVRIPRTGTRTTIDAAELCWCHISPITEFGVDRQVIAYKHLYSFGICYNLHPFCRTLYSSSCPFLSPERSGMVIIFTTMLVQPVKCCVR